MMPTPLTRWNGMRRGLPGDRRRYIGDCRGRVWEPGALRDVFSYALVKVRGSPLLYKGDDFARTDVVRVTAPA